jgi:2-desacetyl-2-hydroxyethyl bacteriochlorophyllide A dehydrogenase
LAVLTEPLAVAVHDVRRSRMQVGQDVLIIGGGAIGLFIAVVSELAGGHVWIAEVDEYRRKFAEEMGYTTLDPTSKEYYKEIDHITCGNGFDIVFEVSGSEAGISSTISLAKISGTVMIVGMSGEPCQIDTTAMFLKQLDMRGVRIHSQSSFSAAVDLLANKGVGGKLTKLISACYPLDKIEEAYDYMKNHTDYFKLIIKIGEDQ